MKKLITLCTLCLLLLLTSCASFKRCSQKFANTVTDSVKVAVPISVLVPRDSVITSFVTDTTYLYKEVQQGRAKVIVERTNTITTVQARCDTVTIEREVMVRVPGPRVVWGVAPFYKKWFNYLLISQIFTLALCIFLYFHPQRKDDELPRSEN